MDREKITSFAKRKSFDYLALIPEYNKLSEEQRIIEAAALYEAFMKIIGIDTDDHNAKETAYRVAKMNVLERCSSLHTPPPELTVFPNTQKYDEYVVVRDIPYYSVCSHHHVVFYGKAHIAYHPKDKIIGLSKLARVVTYYSKKPQIQEELTKEIIDYLYDKLEPQGIIVVIEGRHMCMEARGAKATGSTTITSAIKGAENFDKNEALKLFNLNK